GTGAHATTRQFPTASLYTGPALSHPRGQPAHHAHENARATAQPGCAKSAQPAAGLLVSSALPALRGGLVRCDGSRAYRGGQEYACSVPCGSEGGCAGVARWSSRAAAANDAITR